MFTLEQARDILVKHIGEGNGYPINPRKYKDVYIFNVSKTPENDDSIIGGVFVVSEDGNVASFAIPDLPPDMIKNAERLY